MRRQTYLTAKTASTLLVLWGTACTTTIREPNWQDSATQVQATTGYALDMEPRSMPVAAEDVLAGGLSLDQAMHLALARSMRLQAAFHAVGVAEADYAQSQMLSNPSLSFGLLAPFQGGRPQLTVDALQPLQDLWYREERVASADAERLLRVWQLCEVAQQVLVEVRAAWLATVEARAWQTQLEGERELARIEVELQRELVALGEGVQVDLSRAASAFETAQLALHEHQASVGAAHIRLQAALSMSVPLDGVTLQPTALQTDSSTVDAWVAAARTQRIELRLRQAETQQAEHAVALAQAQTWPAFSAGLSYEQPAEGGSSTLGPAATVELPIFQSGAARVAAARQELLRRQALLTEAEREVSVHVQQAWHSWRAATEAEQQASTRLLPAARTELQLTQELIEAGAATRHELLAVQRHVLEAEQAVLRTQLQRVRAQLALEEASGRPLATEPPPSGL